MMLLYDCEIIKGILGKNEPQRAGIEYCAGWRDFENMGLSVICAYDYADDRYRVFTKEAFSDFAELADKRNPVVGFNSKAFDDCLCEANGLKVETEYDLLVELWKAAGLAPQFVYPTHIGFGLDATAKANLGRGKTGHGALAPVLWQCGEIGRVIDYCLDDVRLLKELVDRVEVEGRLQDPRDPERSLEVAKPRF